MTFSTKSTAFVVLLILIGGLSVDPAMGQRVEGDPQGEVTRVDGDTLYVRLADSITVDAGVVGRVVEERVVNNETVQLSFAVMSVQRVDRPVNDAWVAACQITRRSRNLEPGDQVQFNSVSPRPRLTVRTEPSGARVSVDGTEAGTTPLEGSVERGSHEVTITLKGYESVTRTFSVGPGETARIQDTLQTAIGTLTVTSLPDSAIVQLGDQTLGQTPLSTEVQEGTYTLRVSRTGYLPDERSVTIQSDTEKEVNVPMKRPLQVTPADQQDNEVANVKVDREGDRLIVTYNLVGNDDSYTVELLLSTNDGETFEPLPKTLAGAIGEEVTPGKEKQIVWAATEDFPEGFTGSENRLRVSVEPEGGGLYWIIGSVLTAGAGATAAAVLGVFGGESGSNLPNSPPPAPN